MAVLTSRVTEDPSAALAPAPDAHDSGSDPDHWSNVDPEHGIEADALLSSDQLELSATPQGRALTWISKGSREA